MTTSVSSIDARKAAEELEQLLHEKLLRDKERTALIHFDERYPWQDEFIAATSKYHEACLCAANRIGKTRTGILIDAMHLLGDYPWDWGGHRFDFAPTGWVLGYSMEKTRDLIQTPLFGRFRANKFEGGLIPADRILDWESAGGTPNAMRTVIVKHASGFPATLQFWSYSQGQHAMMGDSIDFAHIDEEPRDQQIRPQVLTRTANGDRGRGGRIHYTLTPENGRTELIVTFMDNPSPSQFFMQKGWDDAPHITKETAERLLAAYPSYQREMRSKGTPMLGHGRIYDVAEDFLLVEPFEIPDHWFVINGMDFGDDHPQAHVQLVEDRDNNVFYLTHAFKARRTSANDAWSAVKSWSQGIPVAWPHDGLQKEKGRDDSKQLRYHYSDAGFHMLHDHARWPTGSLSVETGIFELSDLMRKGQFKVFKGLEVWMQEYRQYHRDEQGRVVKSHDDLLDATRTAYMMRRYAVRKGLVGRKAKVIQFAGWG